MPSLGYIFVKQERWEEARTILLKLVSILKAMRKDDVPHIHYSLATVCFELKKWSESEEYLVQTIEMLEKQEIGLNYLFANDALAIDFLKQGKLVEAEATIVKGINTIITRFGETHSVLPRFLCNLANIYYLQGRLSEAELTYILVIDKMNLLPVEYFTQIVSASFDLYIIYEEEKRSEAEQVLISVIDLIQSRRFPNK